MRPTRSSRTRTPSGTHIPRRLSSDTSRRGLTLYASGRIRIHGAGRGSLTYLTASRPLKPRTYATTYMPLYTCPPSGESTLTSCPITAAPPRLYTSRSPSRFSGVAATCLCSPRLTSTLSRWALYSDCPRGSRVSTPLAPGTGPPTYITL